MKRLDSIPYYRKIVNLRDELAEYILIQTKRKSTHVLDLAFTRILDMVGSRYDSLHQNNFPRKLSLSRFEHELDQLFETVNYEIYAISLNQRRMSYMLTHAIESIVLAQIYKQAPQAKLSQSDINQAAEKIDPDLYKKIYHGFAKLRRKIMLAIEQSIFQDETKEQAVGRVFKALPKRERMEKVRKLKRLRPVREADTGTDAAVFSITGKLDNWKFDPITWQKLMDEYEKDYLPIDSSPANVVGVVDPNTLEVVKDDIPNGEAVYGWEVEKATTEDFVSAVRAGEIDSAKENGVTDFIWVAILDKKTCEVCCEWRDGLTSTEIKEKLEERPDLAEACDAIVPKAHDNCRCRVAPFSDALEAFEPDTDEGLEEWLQSLQ